MEGVLVSGKVPSPELWPTLFGPFTICVLNLTGDPYLTFDLICTSLPVLI